MLFACRPVSMHNISEALMTTSLKVGSRIYRPARLVGTGDRVQVVLETPSVNNSGDGTFMLRAAPREAYLPDWLAVPWETAGGRVCVCDVPVPDDWTWFEVLFADVNFVAVSPVAGDPEELRRKHLLAEGRAQESEATGKR
jgi:hypothetical protein